MPARAHPMLASSSGVEGGGLPGGSGQAFDRCQANVGLIVLAVEDPGQAACWGGLGILLDHLFLEGLPCVATSAGPRRALADLLRRIGCLERLPMRIGAEDLPPQAAAGVAVALACSRLAIPAGNALVIADGPRGVAAGRAAGCCVVGLGGAGERDSLRRLGAGSGVDDPGRLVPLHDWLAQASSRR